MTAEQVRAAIEHPAAAAGPALEPGLVDRVVQDLGTAADSTDRAGSLPLLSYVLQTTWLARSGHTMTLAGYQAAGGIADAVRTTAEKVYAGFETDEERGAARRALLSLVRVGVDSEDTRNQVRFTDLTGADGSAGHDAAARVLTALDRARLIEIGRAADGAPAAEASAAPETDTV